MSKCPKSHMYKSKCPKMPMSKSNFMKTLLTKLKVSIPPSTTSKRLPESIFPIMRQKNPISVKMSQNQVKFPENGSKSQSKSPKLRQKSQISVQHSQNQSTSPNIDQFQSKSIKISQKQHQNGQKSRIISCFCPIFHFHGLSKTNFASWRVRVL